MDTLELRRQIVHASGILTILPLLWFGKWTGLVVTGSILAIFLIWAMWRQNMHHPSTGIGRFAESFVTKYERSGERPLMGAITFYVGATLAILFFNVAIAAASIAVLALADSASTVIGSYLGKHKLAANRKKSWEGSAAFWLTSFAVLLVFVSPLRAFAVALMAMTVEALPKIDDNISIPLTVGILLTALSYFNI